ncbi:hypothetical protein O7632_26900 [Solwaraspora sp. WMMD406]|uniref:hypothetical protein n=1 Tax=Solwaraspora sp. WMMD406 TaxID=3016095 RepID=UPI0024169D6D|nr:hypothetical protein [Solwaraspora sp. WMMD406]MDG4767694.1 hypothetical protein [Solwaraspora sp. WMMD406]
MIAAVDTRLDPILRSVVDGAAIGGRELAVLVETIRQDPVSGLLVGEGNDGPWTAVTAERQLHTLRRVWPAFARWWRAYFSTDGTPVPLVELWRLYLPLAEWIVTRKRRRRSNELYVVGFNGSPGAGKTVLTNALAVVLDELLDADTEGRAVARSGDHWYLGRRERELLVADGYDPGVPGVSNRSLPGTHDLAWLLRNLREMEHSHPGSVIRMANFDKKIDDHPSGPDRWFEVRGTIGVLLFDLWFAGADTTVDPLAVPDGLRRRVAEHLRSWRPVFDRMDALWCFDWPSFEQMVREREAQEQLVERWRGARGMGRDHIRAFMAYMIDRAWDWQVTSPIPPDRAITFRARRDTDHRVIALHRGGRAS